jgi:hypothetical protein
MYRKTLAPGWVFAGIIAAALATPKREKWLSLFTP